MDRATIASVLSLLVGVSSGCGSMERELDDHDAWMHEQTARALGANDFAITIRMFYEELAPYGQWLDHPAFGRIFVPYDATYRPYRNGRWLPSDRGLVWLSYDAIGWAVCHYGVWTILEDGRWAWIPGTEWAPAWVEWRASEQYVGWAPKLEGAEPAPQELWVFIEITFLLVDALPPVIVPPEEVPDVYADCSTFGAPSGAWYGPPLGWMTAYGVPGLAPTLGPPQIAGPPGPSAPRWPPARPQRGYARATPPHATRQPASATPPPMRMAARATPPHAMREPASATPPESRGSVMASPARAAREPAIATPPEAREPVIAVPAGAREPVIATAPGAREPVIATPPGAPAPVIATPPRIRIARAAEPATATPERVATATPAPRIYAVGPRIERVEATAGAPRIHVPRRFHFLPNDPPPPAWAAPDPSIPSWSGSSASPPPMELPPSRSSVGPAHASAPARSHGTVHATPARPPVVHATPAGSRVR